MQALAPSDHQEPWVHAKAPGFSFEDEDEPIKGFNQGEDMIKFRKRIADHSEGNILRGFRPRAGILSYSVPATIAECHDRVAYKQLKCILTVLEVGKSQFKVLASFS